MAFELPAADRLFDVLTERVGFIVVSSRRARVSAGIAPHASAVATVTTTAKTRTSASRAVPVVARRGFVVIWNPGHSTEYAVECLLDAR